jgi:diguanylate cyclase (GGDEF)-like protein
MGTVITGINEFSQRSREISPDARMQRAADLDELLTLFGEQVFALPEVDGGAIHLLNAAGDALVTAHLRLPDEFRDIETSFRGFQYSLAMPDVNTEVFQSGEAVLVSPSNIEQIPDATRLRYERMKMHSLLVVPLHFVRNDGSLQKLGVITLYSHHALLDMQLARHAEQLGAQHGAYIDVHWRLRQSLERSVTVEAMYDRIRQFISGITEMNSRTQLAEVYDLIGKKFIERFGFDMTNLLLLENGELTTAHFAFSDEFQHLAPKWKAFTDATRYTLDPKDGQTPLVVQYNKLLRVGDVMNIMHLPMSDKDRKGLMLLETARTFLLVPVRLREEVVGVMWLISLREPLQLSETDLMLIDLLGSFISTAIQNAQAHARVGQQNREIEALNRELSDKVTLLDRIARKDGLTGLNNFGNFEEELRRRISECERAGQDGALSVILFDVDRFKQFNDTFGHPAGNQVLQEVAARILKCSREMDFVARYGGEEFAVILPQCSLADAVVIADRIRAAISDRGIVVDGKEHAVTVSGGCARLRYQENSRDFICRADEALYRAKHNGRNRIEKS